MGLFGLFKKKVIVEKPAGFENINPLDVNSIITSYQSQNPNASENDTLDFIQKLAAPEKDQNHLAEDGSLPWGWYSVHDKEIQKLESEYKSKWKLWYDSRSKAPRDYLNALESFVDCMKEIELHCRKQGECFNYWRESLFTDDYLLELKNELTQLKDNIEVEEASYQAKRQFEIKILPSLETELNHIIKENPGILQKDIYKMFVPEAKPYISEKLYFAEKSNRIKREKHGSTYKLFMK